MLNRYIFRFFYIFVLALWPASLLASTNNDESNNTTYVTGSHPNFYKPVEQAASKTPSEIKTKQDFEKLKYSDKSVSTFNSKDRLRGSGGQRPQTKSNPASGEADSGLNNAGDCGSPAPVTTDACPGNSLGTIPAGAGCPGGLLDCGVHQDSYVCIDKNWTPVTHECCANSAANGGTCANTPHCGNNVCEAGEDCGNCPNDCQPPKAGAGCGAGCEPAGLEGMCVQSYFVGSCPAGDSGSCAAAGFNCVNGNWAINFEACCCGANVAAPVPTPPSHGCEFNNLCALTSATKCQATGADGSVCSCIPCPK